MDSGTVRLFDEMAGDYDRLEPWYAHLYDVLHGLVGDWLAPPDGRRRRALDAGCGTGYQSAILAAHGYLTHGVDVSTRLLAVARDRLPGVALVRATVERLPYPPEAFDVVCCCGSTLSFVAEPERAVAEMARVLRPGGLLLLECEHAWSLDVLWSVADALSGGRLGYGLRRAEAWRLLARRPSAGCVVRYPGYGAIRLFTMSELASMLGAAGLAVERARGIHMATNLIPSTVLHRPRLGRGLAAAFRALAALDGALRRLPGTHRLANSLVVLARKRPPAAPAALR